jgi:hypothetical protein
MEEDKWKKRIAQYLIDCYKTNDCVAIHIFNTVINELLWHATTMKIVIENNNEKMVNIKFIGQQYWSKSAVQKYCENNPINIKKKNLKELRHEHAVPRIMIKKKIIEILKEKKTKADKVNEIYSTIKTFSKSVIITKEEDLNLSQKNKMSFNLNDKIFRTLNNKLQSKLNEGDCIINNIKKYRYNTKNEIKIIDLKKELKTDKITYDHEDFKILIHKLNTDLNSINFI